MASASAEFLILLSSCPGCLGLYHHTCLLDNFEQGFFFLYTALILGNYLVELPTFDVFGLWEKVLSRRTWEEKR